jgi:mannosylglycoprotein endo-beta-mannosidase
MYDLDSKKIHTQTIPLHLIAADTVMNNLLQLDFSKSNTAVQFIYLEIKDDKDQMVTNSFYWRSSDKYMGKETMTGPTTAGFESLSNMKPAKLKVALKVTGSGTSKVLDLSLTNTSKQIAFFTQLQFLDANGKPVRPSFYTDNFFSLLPGQSKQVRIENNSINPNQKGLQLMIKGWNTSTETIQIH